MKTALTTLTCLLAAAVLSAPAHGQEATGATAEASFINAEGEEIGTATLTQTEAGVAITGRLTGIPAGEHGFHIHETGTCDPASGFESAGDHLEPGDHQHGFENEHGPHAGDMRNQMAGEDGELIIDATNEMVSLTEGEDGYLLDADGSALVVHAEADDYRTDPSGESGDRIACAVVEGGGA